MHLNADFVLNDIFKCLPSIPFALLCAHSDQDENTELIVKLNYYWSYEVRLYTDEPKFIKLLCEFEEVDESKARIIKFLKEMKLCIKEAIIVYDSEYQIMDVYHFDSNGNALYSFNSVRFSNEEVAIEYDLFASKLDDKECLKDYQSFISVVQKDTAARNVVLQEPGLLEVIRKKKLEVILYTEAN